MSLSFDEEEKKGICRDIAFAVVKVVTKVAGNIVDHFIVTIYIVYFTLYWLVGMLSVRRMCVV